MPPPHYLTAQLATDAIPDSPNTAQKTVPAVEMARAPQPKRSIPQPTTTTTTTPSPPWYDTPAVLIWPLIICGVLLATCMALYAHRILTRHRRAAAGGRAFNTAAAASHAHERPATSKARRARSRFAGMQWPKKTEDHGADGGADESDIELGSVRSTRAILRAAASMGSATSCARRPSSIRRSLDVESPYVSADGSAASRGPSSGPFSAARVGAGGGPGGSRRADAIDDGDGAAGETEEGEGGGAVLGRVPTTWSAEWEVASLVVMQKGTPRKLDARLA